jgi:hypothetical protein
MPQMPAKTPAKKTPAAKKASPAKAARPAKPAAKAAPKRPAPKPVPKLPPAKAAQALPPPRPPTPAPAPPDDRALQEARARVSQAEAARDALKVETEKLHAQLRERDDQLRQAQQKGALHDKDLAEARRQTSDARKPDPQVGQLTQQLRDSQARLATRQTELEAARAEAANLREAVAKSRAPGEKGSLRCPRCGGKMTEYDESPIKADRCDSCHGIFFDNGELEAVLQHHDEQRDAGKKGWFSNLLGRR